MSSHGPTAALLQAVFPASDATSGPYVDWLYEENPRGRVIQANEADPEGLTGHYAVVPQDYWCDGTRERWALSLNTATADRARGKGLFTRLARASYEAAGQAGVAGIVGVANANSTPGFTRKLDFQLVTALDAQAGLALPLGDRRVTSRPAAQAAEQIAAIADWEQSLAGTGIAQAWDAEALAWRLRSPRGPLAVHLHQDGAALVSRRIAFRGVPIAAILGSFGKADPRTARTLVRAALAFWKVPGFVYGGHNRNVPITGMPVPQRLRPSPLNLIWRDLTGAGRRFDPAAFRRFEFIDFDAY